MALTKMVLCMIFIQKINDMTYSITIGYNHSDPKYINGLTKWEEVLDILKNKLDQWVIKVHIYKWSKNDRCIGSKCVTMGNLWDVCSNGTDKVLL